MEPIEHMACSLASCLNKQPSRLTPAEVLDVSSWLIHRPYWSAIFIQPIKRFKYEQSSYSPSYNSRDLLEL
uniref:Uncharacterized protein n=1 Tax=Timema cristinae TaxID=61476 RepID=A0A7R9DK21_TIMCR|nr:unnamed protein product [Timema cristinae]